MYQVKAQCGYEIQVLGSGENGPCRITNSNNRVVFRGTYAECVKWLERRAVALLAK